MEFAAAAVGAVAGALIGAVIGSATAAASGGSSASDAQVIARFAAGQGSALFYELAVACSDGNCPISIRLTQDGKVIGSEEVLEWPSDGGEVTAGEADATLGAADPLATEGRPPGWQIGTYEGGVSVAARTVRLAEAGTGLLVDEMAGFEHVKRQHYLFAVSGGQLRRVWVGSEGNGPTWSAVAIVAGATSDRDDIVVFEGFLGDAMDDADRLDVTRLAFNSEGATLAPVPTRHLHAVVVGDYATAAAAHKARRDAGGCLDAYSALPKQALDPRAGAGIVLAAVTTQQALAEAALASANDCLPAGPNAPRLSPVAD
jgi:hypothetical protein